MKLIFLDIDGVLNGSNTTTRAPSGVIGLDEDKCLRLRDIINRTKAKVILTSTWKTDWDKTEFITDLPPDGEYLEKTLQKYGIHILDKTTDPSWAQRGQGILDFIHNFQNEVESFVILDDGIFDYEDTNLMNHLVKTKYLAPNSGVLGLHLVGLQDYHIDEAVRILNG